MLVSVGFSVVQILLLFKSVANLMLQPTGMLM